MNSLGRVGAVVSGYLVLFGAALWWLLAGDIGDGVICAAPVVVAVVLANTSQADRRQYVARLLAAGTFPPALLLMWASSHDRASLWLLALALCLVLAFLALIAWLAGFATRIDAVPGVAPVAADVLHRRLASLCDAGGRLGLTRKAQANAWLFDLRLPGAEGRTHRVLLELDARQPAVRVREFLGASAAAPLSEHERSMRTAGEHWFDPSRPEAQATWSRTWQATMIEPERLARAAQGLDFERAKHAWPKDQPIDGEALVTTLAAIVTRSGYAWHPRLLPFD